MDRAGPHSGSRGRLSESKITVTPAIAIVTALKHYCRSQAQQQLAAESAHCPAAACDDVPVQQWQLVSHLFCGVDGPGGDGAQEHEGAGAVQVLVIKTHCCLPSVLLRWAGLDAAGNTWDTSWQQLIRQHKQL